MRESYHDYMLRRLREEEASKENFMKEGVCVPSVVFKTRQGDAQPSDGGCSFEEGKWVDVSTQDIFANKRVIIFSLPGAFTPTCTSKQLPGFEDNYAEFKDAGIDDIYCVSVNDSFVMNAWADILGINNVKVIPDGTGEFTRQMGMLIDKRNIGFGLRSWRYAAIVDNGVVEAWFEEPGRMDNSDSDPYGVTDPEKILEYIILKNIPV